MTMNEKKAEERITKTITEARAKGWMESAIPTEKKHNDKIKRNRQRIDEIKQNVDQLGEDISRFVVRNGYDKSFTE